MATSTSARTSPREFQRTEAEIFLRHRNRYHRARKATLGEVRLVQVAERRLEPTQGCEAVVLVRRVDDRHRRRVAVEAYRFDLDVLGVMFADVHHKERRQ
jgi:hypothetical protein